MNQKISILINGKEKRYREIQNLYKSNKLHQEAAAAMEETNRTEHSLLAAPIQNKASLYKKKPLRIFQQRRTSFPVKMKRNAFSKPLIAAAMAAIITGTVLGVLLLMVFSSNVTEAENLAMNPPLQHVKGKEKEKEKEKLAVLPPIHLDFSALQAGVFSSEGKAIEAMESIGEKGFSSSILATEDEKFSVLIGVGNEKHQLEKYKEEYEREMDKLFLKNISFSFNDLKTPSNLDETYFTNGKILLQNILTLSQLPGTNQSALENTWNDFNKWKSQGKNQSGPWKEETVQAAGIFEKNLQGTLIALKETKKTDVNWAFQQKVMDSLQSYKTLLETLQ
jgi:stage II sporulation protein B